MRHLLFFLCAVLPMVGVTLTDELRRLHASLLRQAMKHAYASLDTAAREAEIDPAQFQRQLEMVEGSHKRLAMQAPAFWQWYAVVLAETFGLPRETRAARHLERAAVSRKRMARASMKSRKAVAS